MSTLPVFIGYDPSESIAAYVLAHSITRRSSKPVSITFLRQDVLRKAGVYTRAEDEHASTEFSLTRFLTPSLARDYGGLRPALFLDCDMLMLGDVAELFGFIGGRHRDVYCCQHDYAPSSKVKMDNNTQWAYPRKNWSSLMLFDKPRVLTEKRVNTKTPAYLHRMEWADDNIGALPLEWNWLVGEYDNIENPKCLHWTLGGPWWEQYRDTPYADLWFGELENMRAETKGHLSSSSSVIY